MYLLLFVIAAISTAIANPLPADEAHREKPLTFSLNEDNPPSTYSEPAYHDDRVHNAAYGTILDKHQIPSGVTSEYPVGDMHLPLQMPKTLDPAIFNALKETESHIPKLDYMDHGSWSLGSWSPWKRPSDGAQPDSKCGESKSVCCMGSFTSSTSVVKSCNREKSRRDYWESPCQAPQYFNSCDELWALIDDRNTPTEDMNDRRKVILKDGHPILAPKTKSDGITCYSDCKRPDPPKPAILV